MIKLGVNIDHVATIRQARRTTEPDPVAAAVFAELAGADGITVHLREDRRHIQDRDVRLLRQTVQSRLNLEMAVAEPIVEFALEVKPEMSTLVPERREEVTTEGGLDVAGQLKRVTAAVRRLQKAGIVVSLFIDPSAAQVKAAAATGAAFVEFHTGRYADARGETAIDKELQALLQAARLARKAGLRVNAGHGLNYRNVAAVCAMAGVEEFNIGHSIISRAVLVGLDRAIREMRAAIDDGVRALQHGAGGG